MRGAKFRGTTILMVGSGGVLAGVGLACFMLPVPTILVILSVLSVLMLYRQKSLSALSIMLIAGVLIGLARGAASMQHLARYTPLLGREVTLEALALADGVYEYKQLTFDVGQARVVSPYNAALPGRISVRALGLSAVHRGDVVRLQGKLQATRGSRQARMSFVSARIVQENTSPIEQLRLRFMAGMQSALPEPHASLGLGLLIGQRATLPEATTGALSAVGLTHIIAVSGYNLTIIVRFIRRFGRERSAYQVLLLSSGLIMAFVLITGFSASIVRAALVSGFSLLAWYYGRTFRPVLLLLLVAAATALWNPLYIWSDIGWYLSFLAFYGVLVAAPLFARRVHGGREPNPVLLLVYETIAAQLLTMPLVLYIFQETSLVALVSNLLVVPLVPVAMGCALVAGLAGMWVPAIAGWFALPAEIVLSYILGMVHLFARVPGALAQGVLPLAPMLVSYASIAVLSLLLWRKTEVGYDIMQKSEEIDEA
jgi:competence protein ComEC